MFLPFICIIMVHSLVITFKILLPKCLWCCCGISHLYCSHDTSYRISTSHEPCPENNTWNYIKLRGPLYCACHFSFIYDKICFVMNQEGMPFFHVTCIDQISDIISFLVALVFKLSVTSSYFPPVVWFHINLVCILFIYLSLIQR